MLSGKIIYNTIVSAGARIINTALVLFSIGLIARYLGQAGFGNYSIILTFLYFFSILSDLGLYSSVVRDISRSMADEKKIISNVFTLKMVSGFLIFLPAPIISYFLPYPNEVKTGMIIGAFGFWFLSSQQVLMGVFQKYLKMIRVGLAEFISRLVQLALIWIFIWQGRGFLFIVWAMAISSLINFVICVWFARQYISFKLEFDWLYWKKTLKNSLPLALAVIFTVVYFKLDAFMLSIMKAPADVGIYNLAHKITENILFFPAMFVGLVMPVFSKHAFSDKRSFDLTAQKTLNILLVFNIPLVIGAVFISKKLAILVGGSAFAVSGYVLNILIFATAIIFLGILFSNMLISLEKQKSLAYIYGIGAVFNFVLNLFLIPKYTYYGAALATVFTELIVTVLMIIILRKIVKTLPSFKISFKCLIAGLIMALALYWMVGLNIFILVVVGPIVYFAALYLLKGFSINQIKELVRA